MEKGIAFPTCVSVNELVSHYSPLKEEPGKYAPIDINVFIYFINVTKIYSQNVWC